jgi:hypothetical protein
VSVTPAVATMTTGRFRKRVTEGRAYQSQYSYFVSDGTASVALRARLVCSRPWRLAKYGTREARLCYA